MATRRFKVIVTTLDSGQHKLMRRAANPVEAIRKALTWLGLDDILSQPYQVFVEPIGEVRHD